MRMFLSLCVMFGSFVVGDTGLATGQRGTKEPISFATFTKLAPTGLTKAILTELLGNPSEVVDFKKLPDSRETGESWKYEGLALIFEDGANSPSSWTWIVMEGAPEQRLKTAMSRYTGAAWEPETVKWINPHHFPNECFFKDKKQGITIEYNRARKEVSSITRWDPSRKLASSDSYEKPPQFCIGNSCTPAMSAEEFFKEIPVSKYCEIPK